MIGEAFKFMNRLTEESPLAQEILKWANEAFPDEACGVLAGGQVFRLTNVHSEPEAYFQIADEELISMYEAFGDIDGIWHSHPGGDPAPSSADREGAVPGKAYLIATLDAVYRYEF